MWRITAWMKTKTAMLYLAYALKEELNEAEFRSLMGWILRVFDGIDWICSIFKQLGVKTGKYISVSMGFGSGSNAIKEEAKFKRSEDGEYRQDEK